MCRTSSVYFGGEARVFRLPSSIQVPTGWVKPGLGSPGLGSAGLAMVADTHAGAFGAAEHRLGGIPTFRLLDQRPKTAAWSPPASAADAGRVEQSEIQHLSADFLPAFVGERVERFRQAGIADPGEADGCFQPCEVSSGRSADLVK